MGMITTWKKAINICGVVPHIFTKIYQSKYRYLHVVLVYCKFQFPNRNKCKIQKKCFSHYTDS